MTASVTWERGARPTLHPGPRSRVTTHEEGDLVQIELSPSPLPATGDPTLDAYQQGVRDALESRIELLAHGERVGWRVDLPGGRPAQVDVTWEADWQVRAQWALAGDPPPPARAQGGKLVMPNPVLIALLRQAADALIANRMSQLQTTLGLLQLAPQSPAEGERIGQALRQAAAVVEVAGAVTRRLDKAIGDAFKFSASMDTGELLAEMSSAANSLREAGR